MKTLCLEKIIFAYPGQKTDALHELSVRFNHAERIALIGRNGSGKSTLMLIANGLLQADQGDIYLNGELINRNKKSLRALREHVGIVFQNPDDQLFSANVYQDISSGPLNLGLTEKEARERVDEVISLCDITNLVNRPTHALSGGEKARVAIAGILAMRPDFLFVDEVTNSLDPWMREQVLDILYKWVENGHTVILSTHDWRLAKWWAKRVIWLDKGAVYKDGKPEEVMRGPELPREYQTADGSL